MTMHVGADRRCTGRFGGPPCSLIPVPHLRVIVDGSPTSEAVIAPKTIVQPDLPGDLALRPLPGPCVALDDGLDYHLWVDPSYDEDDAVFSVPEGERSVVAPADLFGCTGSVTGMLEVDAQPSEAVALIAGQADESGNSVTGRWDGRGWAHTSIDSAGGYAIGITGIERDGGGSTVGFSDCGD